MRSVSKNIYTKNFEYFFGYWAPGGHQRVPVSKNIQKHIVSKKSRRIQKRIQIRIQNRIQNQKISIQNLLTRIQNCFWRIQNYIKL